jgi:hypothetical protein
VYLEARWHDPSLAHSRKTVKRPLDQIWHPHLQFVNQRAAWRTFPEIADVLGNGKVIYRQRVWGSFAQPLDLRAFPFDRQLLTIPIVAAGSTARRWKSSVSYRKGRRVCNRCKIFLAGLGR